MPKYKLTTVATFSDNTEIEEDLDLQHYVDLVADDILDTWDTADVTLEVDGETFRATTEGNRHIEEPTTRLMSHPWHKASEERPYKDCKLLGWFGDGAYDFDIIKYRTKDKQFCNLSGHPLMTERLWWRILLKPNIKEDKQ